MKIFKEGIFLKREKCNKEEEGIFLKSEESTDEKTTENIENKDKRIADKIEREPREARIDLHFMRHGEKEKDPQKANEKLMLTRKGKEMSYQKGKRLKAKANQAIAWGG